ncbi:MAG TPA: hypothetical protein VM100_14045, partial [Longimicrobiales bacterium]|nr:hypothetical protein [Longimicrobiales bacterium]
MPKNMNAFTHNPRWTGLFCGVAAVALGLAYLVIAGAPLTYIIGNVCGTLIGIGCFVVANKSAKPAGRMSMAWWGFAALLLVTTMFGVPVEGATRWVRLGSLMLQPSLIVVPAMLVAYSQRRGLVSTVSIIVAAVVLALQPDRAMAAVLASGTIVLAIGARDRLAIAAAL